MKVAQLMTEQQIEHNLDAMVHSSHSIQN